MPSPIRPKLAAALAVALMLEAVASAAAQTTPPEDRQAQPAPQSGTQQGGDDQGGNLSERLNRSNGVITPPKNVDPGMSAPVPNPHPHTTPVIPPPGSPGGKRDVHPK